MRKTEAEADCKGVQLMEVFGIPVVFTLHDMLSLGGIALVLVIYVVALLVGFVLWVARLYMKWREKR